MVKQTKRVKRFQASGGVKARIDKGTITKHGKLRKRRTDTSSNKDQNKKENKNETESSINKNKNVLDTNEDDFVVGAANVGGLDMDNFLINWLKKLKRMKQT